MKFAEKQIIRKLKYINETIRKFYLNLSQEEFSGLAFIINDTSSELTFDAIPLYESPPTDLFKDISDSLKEAALLIASLVSGEERILAKSIRERAEFFGRIARGENVHDVFLDLEKRIEQEKKETVKA